MNLKNWDYVLPLIYGYNQRVSINSVVKVCDDTQTQTLEKGMYLNMRHFLLFCGLVMGLVACGSTATPTAVPPTATLFATNTPHAAPATAVPLTQPTATQLPQATMIIGQMHPLTTPEAVVVTAEPITPTTPISQTNHFTIPLSDGLVIQATLYQPDDSDPHPGVILVHMLGSNRQVWQENGLGQQLATAGFVALAIDLRGHGETGGEVDWAKTPDDIRQIWQAFVALDQVIDNRTAVVGASIGANLALQLASQEPTIRTVALLSPGLDYHGITTDDAVVTYGERPLLIAYSSEDSQSADAIPTLRDTSKGDLQLVSFENAGHGTAMFAAQPNLSTIILNWLKSNL